MARTKGSDSLYRLIRSLTTEEKGYFKKFAKRHTGKDTRYLRLFDKLDSLKEYEEAKLKEYSKNLSADKNYLFGLVMDSLVMYHNKPENIEIYLDGLHSRAKILQKKGLPEQAEKEYKRGKELAMKNGLVIPAYRFAFEHSELEKLDIKPSGKMQYYARRFKLLESLLQKEQEIQKYLLEDNKVHLLLLKTLEGVDFKIKKADIDFKTLYNQPAHLVLKEKISRCESLILYFISTGNHKKAAYFAKEYHQLTAAQKNLSNNYSRSLMLCAYTCILNRKYTEAAKWLDTLKKFRSPNEHINYYNVLRHAQYRLMLYAHSGQTAKGAGYAAALLKQYPALFNGAGPHQYYSQFITQALYLFFFNKDYEQCFKLLNDMNLSFMRKNTPFGFRDIELTRLMIQAELGNYNVLDSLVRSVAIKLRKYKLEDTLTNTLLRFFKALAGKITDDKRKEFIKLLNKQMEKKDATERSPYLYMGLKPYTEWIASLR